MTSERDPLREPLRLLRESSLAGGFEERLAGRLAEAEQQGLPRIVRFPAHRRALLLVAAIALPAAAAAAAASGYYLQQRAATQSTHDAVRPTRGNPVARMRPSGSSSNHQIAAPSAPAIPLLEALPASQAQERSRSSEPVTSKVERRSGTRSGNAGSVAPTESPAAPVSPGAQRIEALDPFEGKSTAASRQSATVPKAIDLSDSLRRATKEGAEQVDRDRARGSQRDLHGSDDRSDGAARQARERVQARERRGQ